MNSLTVNRPLRSAVSVTRRYASKWPRPRPGTSERPAYHAPDPLENNSKAEIVKLSDEDLTFIHRPPPTAPSAFSLTTAPVSPLLWPRPAPVDGPLPPFIRPSADKAQPERVSDDNINEIKRLRVSNPTLYTRGKLAKMFGTTQNFVGIVAALKKPKRKAMIRVRDVQHETAREKWTEKQSIVRAIRSKRRELW